VQPSPFNGVKLDLAMILLLAVVLVIAVDQLVAAIWVQVLILVVAGFTGMLWLLWRTRRVLRSTPGSTERGGDDGAQ
jgi:hypothetical protein